ncbi:hypothetical protein [Aquimarina sp. 2201CG5-10]|uniref:hypothetical protein n=1 Tax=Aquimarina callyspongiae TaxID=3098150 RepID=UPI002AB52027|nr:hypothetical protein [Aquimarina sp. 2201CG5-10]MDY8135673.1 hypothetical protein [Aquimarina sp. 2201CG5-10]
MRVFTTLFLVLISIYSYGQDNPTYIVDWEELNAILSEDNISYTIEFEESIPSLSYVSKNIQTQKYELMEIDLSVDLRKQELGDKASMLILPKNNFIQPNYTVAIPTQSQPNSNFRITGNGGFGSSTSNGGVRNTVYKDASLYSGAFCPITGIVY